MHGWIFLLTHRVARLEIYIASHKSSHDRDRKTTEQPLEDYFSRVITSMARQDRMVFSVYIKKWRKKRVTKLSEKVGEKNEERKYNGRSREKVE